MKVIDSDKSTAEAFGKLTGASLLVPYCAMLAAGTLGHHHEFLHFLTEFSFFDFFLINVVFALLRGAGTRKWYIKEEK
jgi:hypothetical protein